MIRSRPALPGKIRTDIQCREPPVRFKIRDLLWLIMLAAVLVAWRVDRERLATKVEQLTRRALWQVSGRLTIVEEEDSNLGIESQPP